MRRPADCTRRVALAALLLGLAVPAAAETMYRWVDAEGTVHYSQTPPESGDYRRVESPRLQSHAAPAVEAIDRFTDRAEAARAQRRAAQAEQETLETLRLQRCQAARDRLAFLDEKTAHRLLRVAEDGNPVRYTEEMFQEERARAQAMIDEYCT